MVWWVNGRGGAGGGGWSVGVGGGAGLEGSRYDGWLINMFTSERTARRAEGVKGAERLEGSRDQGMMHGLLIALLVKTQQKGLKL